MTCSLGVSAILTSSDFWFDLYDGDMKRQTFSNHSAMMDLNDQQVTPHPTTPTMFAKKVELLSTAMKRTSEWFVS